MKLRISNMGRTIRIRKRLLLHKQSYRPLKVDSKPEFVELCKWMCMNGWEKVANLCPAVFNNTGRGLMALSSLSSNHLIIKIPRNLLITRQKVLLDVPKLQQIKMTTAECLTFYLLISKINGLATFSSYISTLPSSFSVGGLCESKEVEILPSFLQEQIYCNQNYIHQKFEKIATIWQKLFNSTLTRDVFEWAWFCVNTRAVFYPDADKLNYGGLENNMALAPYLDMFNHDSEIAVQAGFNTVSQCYEIRSKKQIRKYSQVFINYGPHDNAKLFIEYGFIIPRNLHSSVEFSITDLLDLFHPKTNVFEKQVALLKQISIYGNLYCSREGFSWSAQIAMTVLSSNASQIPKICSPMDIVPNKQLIKDLGLKFIAHLMTEIEDKLNIANEMHDSSASFFVAKLLLIDMIDVLECCNLEHQHYCQSND